MSKKLQNAYQMSHKTYLNGHMSLKNYKPCVKRVAKIVFILFMRAHIAKHVQKTQNQGFVLIQSLLSNKPYSTGEIE